MNFACTCVEPCRRGCALQKPDQDQGGRTLVQPERSGLLKSKTSLVHLGEFYCHILCFCTVETLEFSGQTPFIYFFLFLHRWCLQSARKPNSYLCHGLKRNSSDQIRLFSIFRFLWPRQLCLRLLQAPLKHWFLVWAFITRFSPSSCQTSLCGHIAALMSWYSVCPWPQCNDEAAFSPRSAALVESFSPARIVSLMVCDKFDLLLPVCICPCCWFLYLSPLTAPSLLCRRS